MKYDYKKNGERVLVALKRWLVGLFGLLMVVGAASPGFAASTGHDVGTLWLENRVAEQIVRLNLTPGQIDQLKNSLEQLKEHRRENQERIAQVLEKRRDALLSGDDEAVKEADTNLKQVMKDAGQVQRDSLANFVDGLTERQKQVLTRLLGMSKRPMRDGRIDLVINLLDKVGGK